MTWLLTLTGRRFELASPGAYDYDIEEIATCLSRINRFAGHTLGAAYSVAQHSVHVLHETLAILTPATRTEGDPLASEAAKGARDGYTDRLSGCAVRVDGDPTTLLGALLHDAGEAFIVDLPAPIKRLPGMTGYRNLEARVDSAIEHHFLGGLLAPWRRSMIKVADLALLRVEHGALLPESKYGEEYVRDLPAPARALLHQEVVPWSAETARTEFLKAFEWIGSR